MLCAPYAYTQSRPDRDEYVKILYENIEPGSYEQFEKRTDNESTSLGFAYDYHSITHYGSYYFSMSTEPTIQVRHCVPQTPPAENFSYP